MVFEIQESLNSRSIGQVSRSTEEFAFIRQMYKISGDIKKEEQNGPMSNVNICIIQVLVYSIDIYFKVLIFTLKVKIL